MPSGFTNGLARLEGKTALITGASKRIGRAVALAIARHGVNTVLHYRSSDQEAEALARELRSLGVDAWRLQADLAQPNEAEALFARAVDEAGRLDYLVNCAGVFPRGRLMDFAPEDLYGNLEVNAIAPLLLARGFAVQGREGAIVNFLDTRIVAYDREHVPYHLSKRMLFALTRMMAIEFAPDIRVNAVAPGLILPPEGEDETYLQRLAKTNPLNRYGALEGVAETVVFLLRSTFITGQVVFVDGGRHLTENVYGT